MTNPPATPDKNDVEVAVASIQAAADEGARLGLSWQLRPATVTNTSPLPAVYDGDSASISMASMVGDIPVGQRVYAIFVPPSGNFVCGFPGTNPTAMYKARKMLTATSSDVTFISIPTNLRYLRLTWYAAVDAAAVQLISHQVGGDTTAVYSYTNLQVNNTTVVGGSSHNNTVGILGLVNGTAAGTFASGTAKWMPWDKTGAMGYEFSSSAMGAAVATQFYAPGGGLYNGSVPHVSLRIFPSAGNFVSGSDFQLEGAYA
jgi:hypothetical protein